MKRKANVSVLALILIVLSAAFVLAAGKQEVKKSTELQVEPYEVTMFVNFRGECDEATKVLLESIEKRLNVRIKFEVPPSANYAERLQLMLASGDYPEIVLFKSQSEKVFIDAVKSGVVIPITDYIKKAPNVLKYTYDVSWDAMRVLKVEGDNNIYGIPRTSIARADGYGIRKDWLDAVGLSIPEGGCLTIDEFTEILKRFSKNDPDGNGIDDTYGIAVYLDGEKNMIPMNGVWSFGWPFGCIGWQKYDDAEYEYMDLRYSRVHDNFKNALAYMAMLWKNGYVDPDWPLIDSKVAGQRFFQGITGMRFLFAGNVENDLKNLKPIHPEAELTYFTGIKDKKGKVKGGSFSTGNWGLWAILKSAEKPGKIIEVFDYMLGDLWEDLTYGPEGVTYTVKDGKKVPIPDAEYYGWGRATLRRNNDPDFFIRMDAPEELKIKMRKWINSCIEQAVFSKHRGFRPPATDNPVFLDYQKEIAKTVAKIVIGELPVDAYDKALEGWYKAGGEEYMKQMNDYIKQME